MIDTSTTRETPPLTDELLACVRAASSWNIIHRPSTPGTFPARAFAAGRALKRLQRDLRLLDASPKAQGDAGSALRELQANMRLIRSAIRAVSEDLSAVRRLPRINLPSQEDEPRVAAIATAYLRAIEGSFSTPAFCEFLRALQEHEPLTLDELRHMASCLQFVIAESLLDEARMLSNMPDVTSTGLVSVRLESLRTIAHTGWASVMEPLIVFDQSLRNDPAQSYAAMDFDSREFYRKRVAFIARHSDCSESRVAEIALDLARRHIQDESIPGMLIDPRIHRRRIHVGYYLIGKGFPELAARTGFHPPLLERARAFLRAQADYFYITGIEIITVLFITVIILLPLPRFSLLDCLIAALLLLLPTMQCAVDLVNGAVVAILNPDPLPKLDFTRGVPADCSTLVAVPSLLLSEPQVRALVNDLEVRFLANRDAHLHFALLSDLADSVAKPHAKDAHPLVELATRLIDELNAKYASTGSGGFLLLHRHRVFNVRQGVWMGWERKRGKLLDLNKLLAGEFDAFPIKAGRLEALDRIRYVLTLDSDTQLPRGAAARLVGAIAHPLHQAVIDPTLRIVTDGYGILQPRIGVSVRSASRSRMAAIYSGQGGFDIYTRAISDAYQDLYGEGIFTGKGIYEVATLHAVLNHRFPRNALLSHDLIEGAYARAGLASDVELIDDYPSHLSAYDRRKHRWVRGDWQIAPWMFSTVREESGRRTTNPISEISRWKIFDNLRRSLVEPFTFFLFVAGWLGLPGGPLYWTIAPLVLLIFPSVIQLAFGLGRAYALGLKGGVGEALTGFWKSAFIALFNLIFLPHQTLLCFDAIVRALVRRFITGERLLEWETAAQAETDSGNRTALDRYRILTPLVAVGVAALVYFVNPHHHHALIVAAPILLLWALAPRFTLWLNAPPRSQDRRLDAGDEAFLRGHALRIWRYFSQFAGERHHYLIPDNVEEEGLFEAARVSPTNVGLLLNARQAACEFGFLTVPEFVQLTERTLATMARLEKYRGHLFNWYNTETLEPLSDAPFVSSVDSGNLAASLYTLRSGTLALLRRPLLDRRLFSGLRTHWHMMRESGGLPEPRARFSPLRVEDPIEAWLAWLPEAQAGLHSAAAMPPAAPQDSWWINETQNRIDAILTLFRDTMPWMLPEYAPLRALPELAIDASACDLTMDDAAVFAAGLYERLSFVEKSSSESQSLGELGERLRASLPAAMENLRSLAAHLREAARGAEQMAQGMEFSFLSDPGRKILSIGYDVRAEKLHEACYDMLASEARIATFLAIATGEVPMQGWLMLGREHTRAFGRFLLLSWTGTMFEYLMPSLWMRSYPDTLISRTLAASVFVQRSFVHRRNMPWGISESGGSRKDHEGHYHYQAYGVPQIAVSIEATAGPVISPYSTFLALGVDSIAAVRNLRRMSSSGWVGAYGFYEAADYSATRGKPVLVREWMAHHQGMSLLALLNLLYDNAAQRWFHANPVVQSAELLLHEIPSSDSVLRARLEE